MGFLDNNYINSWKQYKVLRDQSTDNPDLYQGYQNQMNSAVGGAALSGLQGITGILDTSLQMAQVPDVSKYENQIDSMGDFRDGKTWDMNQLMASRSAMITPSHVTYEDVGGITDAGIAGGTLSAGLTGAAAGAQIGGPLGALIGGVVGAGAGLIGGRTGKKRTENQVAALNDAARFEAEQNEKYFVLQADRINEFQYDNLYAHRAAEGGGIHIKKANRGKFTEAAKRHHMTVQQFAKHVLSNKNKSKYSATMRKRANFARNAAGWSHAEGGQLDNSLTMESYNSHGGYYSPNNLVRINTGGTHEQNPNGGVQYGMDARGIPNLVEQEENIYKDYVFSDRLKATRSELKKFGLPEAYAGKSFSEIADVLSEEAKDRPNDAVSNNGMGAMLDRLMACQEDHKQRQEQAELRRELSRLSPEELAELETMLAQQEQAPVQEQPQVPVMEQPQPEMAAAPQEQVPAQLPEQTAQMPVVAAYGGPIRVLSTGTPGLLLDPNATLPDEYVPEDGTARAMQHFDERQDRNKAIAGGIDYFFNGPDEVLGGAGAIELLAGPAAVAEVGKVAKGVSKAIKVAEKGKKLKAIESARDVAKAEATAAAGKANAAGKEAERLLAKATKLNEKGKYEEAAELLGRAKTALNTQKVETSAYKAAAKNASRRHPRINTTVPATTETAEGAAATATSAPTWWQRNRGWVIPTAAIGGATSLGIPAGMAIWGGKGKESKRPADAAVGTYSSSDIQEGGRFGVSGYNAYGGPIVRKYEGKKGSHLNTGPVTVALMNPPDYDGWYSSYSTEPMYNSGDYTWARYPSGNTGALPAGSGTSLYTTASTGSTATTGTTQHPVYYQPVQAGFYNIGINGIPNYSITSISDLVEPIPVEERQAAVAVTDATSGTPNGRIQRAPQSVAGGTPRVEQAPAVVVNTPTGPQLVSEANEAIARWANDDARAIEAGLDTQFADALRVDTTPVGIEKGNPLKVTLPNASTRKSSASAQLPVIGRYAEALDAAGKLALNALRGQDYLQAPRIRPTFIDGRLALHDMRYTPTDRQAMYNALSGQINGLYRNLADVTPSLSLPAAMLAAGHSAGIETGNAVAQGNLANNQLLQQVIGVHNNNEATESDFYKGINAANAQIANQTAQRQAYLDAQYDMLNDQNQTALWQAQSALSEKAAKAVAAKATENFHMNQVNSNRALLGYWVDALGWAHYTTPDGSQVVYDTKTGNIVSQTKPTVRPKGFISPEKQKEIQEDIDARIAKMRQKHGLPTK